MYMNNKKPKYNKNIKKGKKDVKAQVKRAQASKRKVVKKVNNNKKIIKTKNTFKNLKNTNPKARDIIKADNAAARIKKKDADNKLRIAKKAENDEIFVKEVIKKLLSNERANSYIGQNVNKRAAEVISLLAVPKTDEQIAEILDMKINSVRRILNILQGYGITNYNTYKDNKGWLSFFWSINTTKIDQFFEYINKNNKTTIITDSCDDYFICKKCYQDDKLVLNFDAVFESNFKCYCGRDLERIDRKSAENLVVESTNKKMKEL